MIHLAYCADRLMAPGLHAAIASSLMHAGGPATLWLYLEGFDSEDIRRIRRTAAAAKPDARVNLLEIDLERFREYRGFWSNHLPYARLALADVIDADRVLYLDADTICEANPAELFHIDLAGNTVAMAVENTVGNGPDGKLLQGHGIPGDAPYYNSGVMVIDIARWRDTEVSRKLRDFGASHPHELLTADQTCLNAVLHDEINTLDRRWNWPVYPGRRKTAQTDLKEPRIYHFVGNPKPWDLGGQWLCQGWPLFRQYAKAGGGWAEWKRHFFRLGTWRRARRLKSAYQGAMKLTQ